MAWTCAVSCTLSSGIPTARFMTGWMKVVCPAIKYVAMLLFIVMPGTVCSGWLVWTEGRGKLRRKDFTGKETQRKWPEVLILFQGTARHGEMA